MKKAIVLAAGEGTRMRSEIPKVLHKVLELSMLKNVLKQLEECDLDEIIVIVGHGKDQVIEEIKDLENVSYRVQPIGPDQPYGTGYAVMQAIDRISSDDEVLIVCGDTPLLRASTLKKLLETNQKNNSKATVLTAIIENNYGYGRILRNKDDFLEEIIEEKDCNEVERKIKEVNSGVYSFMGDALIDNLKKLDTENSQGELYLTDLVRLLNSQGENVGAMIVEDETEILGVNSRRQLADCERILRERIINNWMDQGVTFINPENTYIGYDVKIGQDSIIYPGVRLYGKTVVGPKTIIEGDTSIKDSIIGSNCHIKSSYINDSQMGDYVTIGPFAQLRPGTKLADKVHLGNFVEVKNSSIDENSKAGHLAYIGDTKMGKNVNYGCGAITVNYDGESKHITTIEDNAFIGSNSNLVAPVLIEEFGFVAAGSTITKKVEKNDLVIARPRQEAIKGWVKRKKK